MRRYCLYTLDAPCSSGLLHQVGQLHQILEAKQTPSCGQYHEWIFRQHRRPGRWDRAQDASAVVEVNSVLAPVVAVGDQLEPLAFQRVMWMDDFKSTAGTVAMRSS
jgi:hypothetical protein